MVATLGSSPQFTFQFSFVMNLANVPIRGSPKASAELCAHTLLSCVVAFALNSHETGANKAGVQSGAEFFCLSGSGRHCDPSKNHRPWSSVCLLRFQAQHCPARDYRSRVLLLMHPRPSTWLCSIMAVIVGTGGAGIRSGRVQPIDLHYAIGTSITNLPTTTRTLPCEA